MENLTKFDDMSAWRVLLLRVIKMLFGDEVLGTTKKDYDDEYFGAAEEEFDDDRFGGAEESFDDDEFGAPASRAFEF
jgi:hypothetical protein